MTESVSGDGLHEQLARWAEAGLIDAGQAVRIEAAETARAAERQPQPGASAPGPGARAGAAPQPVAAPPATRARPAAAVRPPATVPAAGSVSGRRASPLVVEAVGYLGGALAVAAGFAAVRPVWPDIPLAAQLACAATAAAALGVGGALMPTGGDAAFVRLRSVLWVMSTACLGAFTGVLVAGVWDFGVASAVPLAAGAATGYAVLLWLRTPAALQQLAMFAAAAVTAGAGIARADPAVRAWGPGLGVWALSALWAAAAHRGYLGPPDPGYIAAGIGLLAGAQMAMQIAAGHVLAIATVAALLTAGVALRRVSLLAAGAIGVIQVVPQTAARYLPSSAAAPLAVVVAGLALLAVALRLSRRRKTPPSHHRAAGRPG
jgi:hypothetical protein